MKAQERMSEPSSTGSTTGSGIGFPEAMEIASQWLILWDRGELSDEVLADRVGELVRTRNGARGFFVVAMTADAPLMDRLPEPLLTQLRHAGEEVVDLTARNLAMSTAMGREHRRNGNQELQTSSERVQERSISLLRQLEPSSVKTALERLLEGTAGKGPEAEFMKRFGYDEEQLRLIHEALLAVAVG